MNIRHIQEILEKRYSGVKEVKPSVFMATYRYRNSEVGIYFFDCTNLLNSASFNLHKYQEDLVSDVYYEKPGSRQWNFYLYFICDSDNFNSLVSSGRVGEIESDKLFAKKYITTEDRLGEELKILESLRAFHKDTVLEDISVKWIEELKINKLDGVFLFNIDQAAVVRRYLDGHPVMEQNGQAELDSELDETPEISAIRRLFIERYTYRQFPRLNDFIFGKVNLIEGLNGSGKTSLLEAIELWICGKTMRNPEAYENARIGIQFDNSEEILFNDNIGNDIYRKRDLHWYGNAYSKGNRLYQGFNRFNMYDADAAFKLTFESDRLKIKDAIAAIVLGETANKLHYRLAYIKGLFEKEQRSLTGSISGYEKEIDIAQEELDSIKTISDEQINHSYRFITKNLRDMGWRMLPNSEEEAMEEFLLALDRINSILVTAQQELSWMDKISLEAIDEECKSLGNLVGRLKELYDAKNTIEKSRAGLYAEREKISLDVRYINEMQTYISKNVVIHLLGLDDRIMRDKLLLESCRHAKKVLGDIDLEPLSEISKSLHDFIDELDIQLNEKRKRHHDLLKNIADIKNELNVIEKITAEIKNIGLELLIHEPELNICPLCGAQYEAADLAYRIGALNVEHEKSDDLQVLQGTLSVLQAELNKFEQTSDALQRIDLVSSMIFYEDDALLLMPVAEVIRAIKQSLQSIDSLDREIQKLESYREEMRINGFSEDHLQVLCDRFQEQFHTPVQDPSFALHMGQLKINLDGKMTASNEMIDKLKTEGDSADLEIQQLISSYFMRAFAKESDWNEIRKRLEVVSSIRMQLEKIDEQIELKQSEVILHYITHLQETKYACERYITDIRTQKATTILMAQNEKRKREARENIAKIRPRKDLADKALEVIGSIMSDHNKDSYLVEVLSNKKRELFEIFKMIHSPREFKDIEIAEDKLSLIRESGAECTITEISSGQRSALALSLFLMINRQLKNGPPYLIFDDPVAYTDDINILAFFDYLRETVIYGKRQVYFATANQKVGSLFKRKYDFLDEEFRSFTLQHY